MKKNILIIIGIMLTLNINVKALTYGGCEYSQITRLKSIVSNINISYDYYINNDNAYFNITLNNLVPEIYFVDVKNDKTYTYNNTINGEITINGNKHIDGSYKFYSAIASCKGVSLGTKYYKLPKYNTYHNSNMCKGIENYSLCKKWADISYSNYEVEELIKRYKAGYTNSDDGNERQVIYEKGVFDYIIDFYVKYYYIILMIIIIICTLIMLIKRKRNKFDL